MRITPQYPPEVREKRKQLGEVAAKFREKDRSAVTKIIAGNLYVNSTKYVEKVTKPTVEEVLMMSDGEREGASEHKFCEASAIEANSSFTVRFAKVQSINDVRTSYKYLLLNPSNMKATHNTAAYRLYFPTGARTEDGYCDDGEHGLGKIIKDTLHELNKQNVVAFVARQYGGMHIGPKRFQIAEDLLKTAQQKLESVSGY